MHTDAKPTVIKQMRTIKAIFFIITSKLYDVPMKTGPPHEDRPQYWHAGRYLRSGKRALSTSDFGVEGVSGRSTHNSLTILIATTPDFKQKLTRYPDRACRFLKRMHVLQEWLYF
jgi:hypothetical protein